jgi:hypothetical protein
MFSKYEQAYLAWAEAQETKKGPSVDEAALREMGLSEEEIAFVKLMAETEEKHHTPAGCGLDDGTRYLLWNVQYFPKTDKLTGRITVQSFVDSVGVSYKDEPRKLEDYFLSIRWTVKHAIDGNYPDSALFRAYRKVLVWCLEFEKMHSLKEKELTSVTLEDNSNDEGLKEAPQQQQQKEVLAEDSEEFEPEETTIKQRNYLSFLMSTIRDEKIRQELQKRLCVLSKEQASKIISELVAGNEEGVLELI